MTKPSLAIQIHTLYAIAYNLQDLACKRVHTNTPHTPPISAPTPLNLSVRDFLDQIQTLAYMLCKAARLNPPRSMNELQLLKGLDRKFVIERLENRSDAPSIHKLVSDAIANSDSLLNLNTARIFIGVCPTCGYGVWIAERTTITGTKTCELCHNTMSLPQVAQAHHLRLLTSGVVGTAADLAKTLKESGYDITRKRITKWAQRKQIHTLHSDSGDTVYRLSEILIKLQPDLTKTTVSTTLTNIALDI